MQPSKHVRRQQREEFMHHVIQRACWFCMMFLGIAAGVNFLIYPAF